MNNHEDAVPVKNEDWKDILANSEIDAFWFPSCSKFRYWSILYIQVLTTRKSRRPSKPHGLFGFNMIRLGVVSSFLSCLLLTAQNEIQSINPYCDSTNETTVEEILYFHFYPKVRWPASVSLFKLFFPHINSNNGYLSPFLMTSTIILVASNKQYSFPIFHGRLTIQNVHYLVATIELILSINSWPIAILVIISLITGIPNPNEHRQSGDLLHWLTNDEYCTYNYPMRVIGSWTEWSSWYSKRLKTFQCAVNSAWYPSRSATWAFFSLHSGIMKTIGMCFGRFGPPSRILHKKVLPVGLHLPFSVQTLASQCSLRLSLICYQ